jgi:hypothetical protein
MNQTKKKKQDFTMVLRAEKVEPEKGFIFTTHDDVALFNDKIVFERRDAAVGPYRVYITEEEPVFFFVKREIYININKVICDTVIYKNNVYYMMPIIDTFYRGLLKCQP